MFKLDNEFLVSLGLGGLPVDEKNKLLQYIYERLEMNVGMRLAEKMTDAQLDEFEGFIDRSDEAGALKWLETNFPNYKDVVAEELEKLKQEVMKAAPQILSAAQAVAQQQGQAVQQPATAPPVQPSSFQAPQQSFGQQTSGFSGPSVPPQPAPQAQQSWQSPASPAPDQFSQQPFAPSQPQQSVPMPQGWPPSQPPAQDQPAAPGQGMPGSPSQPATPDAQSWQQPAAPAPQQANQPALPSTPPTEQPAAPGPQVWPPVDQNQQTPVQQTQDYPQQQPPAGFPPAQ